MKVTVNESIKKAIKSHCHGDAGLADHSGYGAILKTM